MFYVLQIIYGLEYLDLNSVNYLNLRNENIFIKDE